MGPWIMIAAAAAPQAAAQAVPAAPAPAGPDRGVIAYPPGFFAESKPISAYDMVLRVPGFAFDKGVVVRGLAGSSGNVLIDGQPPVSKNDGLDDILKRIPAASVERIELIRGGAPGIDMDGRTILANVVRRQTAGFRGAISPSMFFIYNGKVLPSLRFEGQWRWSGGRAAEFSQVLGTGILPNNEYGIGSRFRYNADGSVRLHSHVDGYSYGARINTTAGYETPLFGGHAHLNGALIFNPGSVEIYDHYRSLAGLEYEFDDNQKRQVELGGRFNRPLNDRVGLETTGFQQFSHLTTTVHFEGPGLTRNFRLDRQSTESTGRVQFRLRGPPGVTLETGAEGAFNHLDSKTDLTVNSRAIAVPAANVQVEELRGEVFARGTWQATSTLTLEAGVRQEASQVTSDGDLVLRKSLHFLKPRAALTWAPDGLSQFRLRVEREVGQLNFDDFVASSNVASTGTVVAGNPDLTPQQAWVYEAAYERRFWGAGAALLTVRHFDITDTVDRGPARDGRGAIIRDPLTGQAAADRPDNIGPGTKDEIQASLTVPLQRFGIRAAQLKLQSTWRDTQVTDPITGRSREISGQHPIDWEGHYSQDLPRWNATWGIDAIGGYRERFFRLAEIETKKYSTWVVVYGEYKPRPDLSIRVEVNGVTLRNARRIREVYVGPRNLGRLDYTDERSAEFRGSVNVRVRKTLG
ncbi:TonB-dependent receptor [Phenylobacterium sp.]|uniref:TonB-dependent receptor plug domain-containing protein n=1 Tax=Phenylobacterium sp. TaxID=1871053 RepID=UPI0025EEC74E|nr:TonB-dependent receptor [Phenylobacterium sp.]